MKIFSILRYIIPVYLASNLFLLYSCDDEIVTTSIEEPTGCLMTDYYPSWSSNGYEIFYIHSDSVSTEAGIYKIDTNGQNKELIYNDPFCGTLDLFTSGNWLVFDSRGQIFKIKTNGDSLTQLTFEYSNFFPSWNYDGEWIAYDSDNSPNGMHFVWKMKADGTNKIRILYDPTNGEIRTPSWSSIDNNKLLCIKYFVGTGGDPDVTIMGSYNNLIKILTNNDNFEYCPKFNFNDSKVAFTLLSSNGINFQIYTINSDGSDLKRITDTQGYTSDFSPDGKCIVYCDSRPNNGRLWIKNLETGFKKQITF